MVKKAKFKVGQIVWYYVGIRIYCKKITNISLNKNSIVYCLKGGKFKYLQKELFESYEECEKAMKCLKKKC